MAPKRRTKPEAKPTSVEQPAPAPAAPQGFIAEERAALRTAFAEWRPDARTLALLLAAALVTRFINLTQPDLWMDEIVILQEAFTGKFATVSWAGHMVHLGPVGFFLRLFGQNAFGLRFWGALLGSLAVPITFLWVRLAVDRTIALAAALFVLANQFLLLYAQDGNFYGGMTFYTSICLLAYVLFFRGAPHAGLVLFAATALLNFKNHPITAVPTAAMLGGMVTGALIFRDVRGALLAWKPSEWSRRPLVPLLGVALLVASPWLLKALPGVATFLATTIDPGAASLTNVEFGWPIFRDHLTAFGINYFRPGPSERAFAILPLVLFASGLVFGLVRWNRGGRPKALLALLGLAVVLPLASYALIFSLDLNRNFNLRYFTYMVPLFLFVLTLGSLPQRKDGAAAALVLGCWPLLIQAGFSVRYLFADKANYAEGVAGLKKEYKPGDRLLVPTRNDRVQSQYYLAKNALPALAPDYQYINQSGWADLAGGALPFAMNGDNGTRILSAWRHVEAPRLYAFCDGALLQEYEGHSKLSEGHDLHMARWDVADRVVYPNLSVTFTFDELTDANAVAITGPGTWALAVDGNTTSETLTTTRPSRMKGSELRALAKADGKSLALVPVLPDSLLLRFDAGATLPDHTKLFPEQRGGELYLRNERDGGYEFLVHQPEGAPRQLVVKLARRDEASELLKKNSAPIPAGMLVSVAVDGRHLGVWGVPGGAVEAVRLPIEVDLAPGNHRVSIDGFQPRSVYTPYFPWLFQGIEWNRAHEPDAKPSGVRVSSGWTKTPAGSQWQVQGSFSGAVDESLVAPAGDHPLRVDFPGDKNGNSIVIGPPMAVEPGTTALFWFHYRLDGVETQEITPTVFFVDASGKPVSREPANGANLRGSTLGGAWVRRQIAAPVPAGAAALVPAFQSFPYKGETEHGTFWIGSLGSPATAATVRDPALPRRYFP